MTKKQKNTNATRFAQAMVDADIEGLARSPEIEAQIARWEADGLDPAEQIALLKRHFAGEDSPPTNA
ncbi:MAG: hypothetical protein AAF371_16710 [Pseudomonadota bacterium]